LTQNPQNSGPSDVRSHLADVAELAQARFTETHGMREQALRLSREMIRNSANSIRASHRGDFDQARALLDKVTGAAREVQALRESQPAVYYAGYVEDAQKEYVEASAVLAIVQGAVPPGLDELGVGPAPYLNGLADVAGELRRYILDSLRRDDFSRCEELLGVMDEIYTVLVSMDFPDAVTRGLRRGADMVRGTLERTRGDLTVALRQHRLEEQMAGFQDAVESLKDAVGDLHGVMEDADEDE
jgi:translin